MTPDIAQALPADERANNDEVICPVCCHQFRAIPVNVQRLLLGAGFEPPFVAPPPVVPSEPEAWIATHESGRVLHLSRHDGWSVEPVVEAVHEPWSKPMGLWFLLPSS